MKFSTNFELWYQIKAMTIRNMLIKRREVKKTLSEIAIPVYTLGLLVAIKLLIPNPHFPPVTVPQESPDMYNYLYGNITVAPSTKNVQMFLEKMNEIWMQRDGEKINFSIYQNKDEISEIQRNNPEMVYIALLFDDDPIQNHSISYKIRTNPFYDSSPLPSKLYGSSHQCRKISANKLTKKFLHRHHHNNNLHNEEISCPAIHYIYSGFIALQSLVDITKISLVTNSSITLPDYSFILFPKPAYTANWLMVFHKVIPLYVVIALSQFVTYLLVQLVGEKERKIKEGMKIMGLRELVFWCSWFNIYTAYVIVLSLASTIILYLLGVFNNTNWILIFLLVFLYSITVIFFSFMISPFFDKSRTAGILGNFVLNLISLMYFLHTFINPSSKKLLWLISLLSPSGFALAIDKAMEMDLAGEGLHFSNIWDGPGMSFGESLLIMAFDALLYVILAYYFDMVLSSQYEQNRSLWACFKTSYWCAKVPESIEFDEIDRYTVSNPDLEPVPESMKELKAIQIINLCKSFKRSTKNVINGINMTIYEGEITAILGHNGAGKTTLFNILTGLTEPTSGTIKVFGYDVRNPSDVIKIRRMIGVCPQYDILFERLTPREHLKFFATLRGLTSEKIDDEVQRMLLELYLTDKADNIAKTLSGGQKRKLSVGIAVIGNPKIIILDEPTAGVDPPARRHLWSLLQKRKKGKVILLTTHFMDEADILADRIAVISKGCVRCCGSSIFLKNKFGIGYHLTLILNNNAKENSIVKMIKEHVPNAERARRHGYELSFVLPYDSVNKFPPLFGRIETEIKSSTNELGIENYGVSMTTLEEVFLFLEQGQHDNSGKLAIELLKGQSMTNCNRGSIGTIHNVTVRSSIIYDPTNWGTIIALLKMRTKRVLRDVHKLYVMILLPVVFLATGIILNKLSHEIQPIRSITLNNDIYKEDSRLVVTSKEFSNYSTLDSDFYAGTFSGLLDLPSHLGALRERHTHNKTYYSILALTVYYNDSFIHSLPIILNSITSTLLGDQIDIKTEPFKMEYKQNEYSFSRCSSAFFLGIVFVLVPVSLSADLVYDREIKAKNQLRINGVTFMQYFSSYFILLISMLLGIFLILIILIALFHVEGLDSPFAIITMVILLIAYCPAAILATACVSYFFEKTDSVQSILPNVTSLIGGVPFIIVASLDMLGILSDLGFALHVLFSSTNFVYVPFAIIYFINSVYRENDDHVPFIKYVNKEIVAILMGCIGQIPALWVILKILDSKSKNKKTSTITIDTQDEGDDDVKTERIKVNNIVNDQVDWPVIVVQNLKKEFSTQNMKSNINCLIKKKCMDTNNERKLAIRNLSLAVNSGEVLGLLGHNGAGKTTTMRIITMEEKESSGKIFIKGHDIQESVDIAYRMIGYCPQHDALWSSLTIREHLHVYGAIRGISKDQIKNIVEKYIEGLQITEHADKQVSCCSGGTRRKLSFALAMIGNPKLVLLDEPSTGMDPRSKRYLWDAIISSFQGSKGAILTTHSMEEADALCSRVGIMVKGQLRCLGSTQYLKNLYGAGYTLEIKLKPRGDMDDVKNFVITSFPNAILEEEFADRLVYGVPQSTVESLAHCFLNLENAKNMYDIQEYSFSQTTLEQVYLKFAHYEDREITENTTITLNQCRCPLPYNMEEHCKSLALQYDLFVNSTLKYLDTATERDYMLKLKVIDQLTYRINQSEADKDIIKKNLEAVQDECSKLTYKLKTSARLLDEAQVEKEKLVLEKETMKSQLKQLHSIFKKQDIAEKSHQTFLNHSDCVQLNEKKSFNNTDALLSDLSYSHSEDSSYENVMKNPKHNSIPTKKCSTGNISNNLNTKKCEIMNVNTSNNQIVAITTLTMDLGSVNAKSVIKTYPTSISQIALSSSDSIEPLSTSESEKENNISEKENNISEKENNVTEKEHNFIQKIIVIPEICGHCHKKIKFNNYMVKCLDCKIITHLECKDFIPMICSTGQLQLNALNCGIPPSIVHCISEIERRGLDTVGLYRVSGSDKEVKNLKDKFRKGLPDLKDIDIHVLCSYLKDLIRMQKYNLISQSDLSKLTDAFKNKNNVSNSLCQTVSELPHSNRNILAFLIIHLQKVASSSKCNMDYNCLAIVFGPTIVGVTSTSLDDLHIKFELISKIVIELLKLPTDFWLSFLKPNNNSPDELLHSTPTQSQPLTPGSSKRFFSSGIKRRILDSPKKK